MKLYSDEEGHEPVRRLNEVVISCLTRVEVPAAIWRKQRETRLNAEEARVLTATFEADYFGADKSGPRFTVLSLPAAVLEHAASLVATHGLRAYDAVQLSTAKAAREVDPGCESMACFDENLREAAATEGFFLIPGATGQKP